MGFITILILITSVIDLVFILLIYKELTHKEIKKADKVFRPFKKEKIRPKVIDDNEIVKRENREFGK